MPSESHAPVYREWKVVQRPGAYAYPVMQDGKVVNRLVLFTPDKIKRYAKTTQSMLDDGISIPIIPEHDNKGVPLTRKDLEKKILTESVGFVRGVRVSPSGELELLHEVTDPVWVPKMGTTVMDCSPGFRDWYRTGDGKKWTDVVAHVALTHHPVDHHKPKFTRAGNAASTGTVGGEGGYATYMSLTPAGPNAPHLVPIWEVPFSHALACLKPAGTSFIFRHADGKQRFGTRTAGVNWLRAQYSKQFSLSPDDEGAIWMAVMRAPIGGISIQGKFFRGGQFIPNEVIEAATPQEKAKIQAAKEAHVAKRGTDAKSHMRDAETVHDAILRHAGVHAKIDQHPLDKRDTLRRWSALKAEHGDKGALERVVTLAATEAKKLQDMGEGAESTAMGKYYQRRLSAYAHMVGFSVNPDSVGEYKQGLKEALAGEGGRRSIQEAGSDPSKDKPDTEKAATVPETVSQKVKQKRDETAEETPKSAKDVKHSTEKSETQSYPSPHEAIEASQHLSAVKKKAFSDAVKLVESKLSAKAKERLGKNLKGFVFHGDIEDLTAALVERSPDLKNELKGKNAGGAYSKKSGEMFLDGGGRIDGKKVGTDAVYAHEYAHAIDGPELELSKDQGWREAWRAEAQKVSNYATKTPQEGFAEFGRLVFSSGLGTDQLRERYPLSMAHWEKLGLLPDGVQAAEAGKQLAEGNTPQMADVFEAPFHTDDAIGDRPLPRRGHGEDLKGYLTGIGGAGAHDTIRDYAKQLHGVAKQAADEHNSAVSMAMEKLSTHHGKAFTRSHQAFKNDDYNAVNGFDVVASEVANAHPGLFQSTYGADYDHDTDTDNKEKLWDMLKEGKRGNPDIREFEDQAVQEWHDNGRPMPEGYEPEQVGEADTSFDFGANVESADKPAEPEEKHPFTPTPEETKAAWDKFAAKAAQPGSGLTLPQPGTKTKLSDISTNTEQSGMADDEKFAAKAARAGSGLAIPKAAGQPAQEQPKPAGNWDEIYNPDKVPVVSNDEAVSGNWDQWHAGLGDEAKMRRMAAGMKGIEGREYGIREHSPGQFQMVSRKAGEMNKNQPEVNKDASEVNKNGQEVNKNQPAPAPEPMQVALGDAAEPEEAADTSFDFGEEEKQPEDGQVHTIPAMGNRSELKVKFYPGRHDGEVGIGWDDAHDKPWTYMPADSKKHFLNDLSGKVDLPANSGNSIVDAIASGKGEWLGKGQDGVVFKVGDKVAKMSTTVPYQPMNPGHRSPQEAVEHLEKGVDVNNKLAAMGIPGIMKQELVRHGDKAFAIRDNLEMPDKLTPEQLQGVRQAIDAIHKAGYVVGDEIQVGLKDGKPYLFDLGNAQKARDDQDYEDDSSRFGRFAEKMGGENLPLRRHAEKSLAKHLEHVSKREAAGKKNKFPGLEEYADNLRKGIAASDAAEAKQEKQFNPHEPRFDGEHPGKIEDIPVDDGKDLAEHYRDKSSRTTPAPENVNPPVGSWRKSPYKGNRGHDIQQLREVPVKDLLLSEDDFTKVNYEGRGDDAKRYAEWLGQGKEPPAIEAVETDDGRIKVSDGHRRLAAHKLAGKDTIKAWVSPVTPTENDMSGDPKNGPVQTGLTHEIAQEHAKNPEAGWRAAAVAAEKRMKSESAPTPMQVATGEAPAADGFMQQKPAGRYSADDIEELAGQSFTNDKGLTVDLTKDEDGTWSIGSKYGLSAQGAANLLNEMQADKAKGLFSDDVTAQKKPEKRLMPGDKVKYTGRGADPDTEAELRGYHDVNGKKMARVIFRPKDGMPFENSVPADDVKPMAEKLEWAAPSKSKETGGELPGMKDTFAPGMFGAAANQRLESEQQPSDDSPTPFDIATGKTSSSANKWKNNGDGTYTSPNGTIWRKAKAGGEESPVTGKRFAGGSLMPIHGLHEKSEKKPEGEGVSSGQSKPNPNKQRNNPVRQMTAEEIEAEKQRREEQKKWDEIKSGPLNQFLRLGDRPHNIKYKTGGARPFGEFGKQMGAERMGKIVDYLKEKVLKQSSDEIDADPGSLGSRMGVEPITKEEALKRHQEHLAWQEGNARQVYPKNHVPGTPMADVLLQEHLDGKDDHKKLHDFHTFVQGLGKDTQAAGTQEGQGETKPANPFQQQHDDLQKKIATLTGETSHDKAIRESFPFGTGRPGNASSQRTSKQAHKRIEKTIDDAVKAQELIKQRNSLKAKADQFEAGNIDEKGNPTEKAIAERNRVEGVKKSANEAVAEHMRSTLKPGDTVYINGDRPVSVKRVNPTGITTDSGSKWKYDELTPKHETEDRPMTTKELVGLARSKMDDKPAAPQQTPVPSPMEVATGEKQVQEPKLRRARTPIHFDLAGPSGAKLHTYDWQFKWETDPLGEDERRVSDWDRAETNEHTGKNIVHQFNVSDANGQNHTVSLETAIKMLGYGDGVEGAAKVKNLAQAAMQLAEQRKAHDELVNNEEDKKKLGHQYRVENSQGKIDYLQDRVEKLTNEARMHAEGKNPAEHYRSTFAQAKKLRDMFHTRPQTGEVTNSGHEISAIAKAAGKGREEQQSIYDAGLAAYKDLMRASRHNLLGERYDKTPIHEEIPESNYYGKKIPAVPAWSDAKMRNWYFDHGEDAHKAIETAQLWFDKYGPKQKEETKAAAEPAEWKEGHAESASDALARVQASPNQPNDRDWERYASTFGMEDGKFHHVEIPTEQLAKNLESGHLRRSNSVNPKTVDEKVQSGDRNPVVITHEPGKGSLVVDGNHSLQAAIKGGDKTVKAIVSEKSPLKQEESKGVEPSKATGADKDAVDANDYIAKPHALTPGKTSYFAKDRDGDIVRQAFETPEEAAKETKRQREMPVSTSQPAAEPKPQPSGPYGLTHAMGALDAMWESGHTPEAHKANFQQFLANREAVRQDLEKMTVDQLKKKFPSWHAKKKSEYVADALGQIANSFNYSGTISYNPFDKGSKEKALQAKIDQLTPEHIAEKQAERAKLVEEMKARRASMVKAITNPETDKEILDHVERFKITKVKPEILKRYDEIKAKQAFEKFSADQRAAYENRQAVKPIDGSQAGAATMHQTKHTKTGEDLHVVRLENRVSKEEYREHLANAKRLGGWYSSYTGGGAIPGFTFKDKAQAEKFHALVGGQEVKRDETPHEEVAAQKKQSRVQGLLDRAQQIREAGESKVHYDGKENTQRRADMAEGRRAAGRKLMQKAETLENIAKAVDGGTAPYLEHFRDATQVDALHGYLSRAKIERYHDLSPEEKNATRWDDYNQQPYGDDDIKHAKLWDRNGAGKPVVNLEGHLSRLADQMKDVPGYKRLAEKYKTGAMVEPQLLTDVRAMAREAQQRGHHWPAQQILERIDDIKRMEKAGIVDDSTLREALRQYVPLIGGQGKEDPIKKAEREIRFKKKEGFFPTPRPIVDQMIAAAELEPGHKILEPSAGHGSILDALEEHHGKDVTTKGYEHDSELANIGKMKGHDVEHADFMGIEPKAEYDRVLMNPPFEKGMDAEHVMRAHQHVKPGGKVVAIMSEGPFFRQDKKSQAFRDWLEANGGTSEKLPEGSFKGEDAFRETGVNTRLVTIPKAHAEAAVEPQVPSPMDVATGSVEPQTNKEPSLSGWHADQAASISEAMTRQMAQVVAPRRKLDIAMRMIHGEPPAVQQALLDHLEKESPEAYQYGQFNPESIGLFVRDVFKNHADKQGKMVGEEPQPAATAPEPVPSPLAVATGGTESETPASPSETPASLPGMADAAGPEKLKLKNIVRTEKNVRSMKDRRAMVTRTVAEFTDSEGNVYRKSFEAKGKDPVIPESGTHEELNKKHQFQFGGEKQGTIPFAPWEKKPAEIAPDVNLSVGDQEDVATGELFKASEAVESGAKHASATPRDVASAVTRALDPSYAFARSSSVGNAGEDLIMSKRHLANAWRGLEQAEADGIAEKLVNRDRLAENEPHKLMTHADENPLTSLAMHFALKHFPAEPGYKKTRYGRALGQTDAETAKTNREHYVQAYRSIKAEAERLAQSESDPRKALSGLADHVGKVIRALRGQVSHDSIKTTTGVGLYNETANALTVMPKKLRDGVSWGAEQSTSPMGKMMEFTKLASDTHGKVPTEGTLEERQAYYRKLARHAKNVIEGQSLPRAFGVSVTGEKKDSKPKITPADMYVEVAERTGGRDTPEGQSFLKKHLLETVGLRGIQFGNYVSDDERIHHLKKAAEAFVDLADVTGLPDNAASLKGAIGLAFGARGNAGALAHYEPDTKVINLTRKSGVGSLAHEWGHALDHFLAGGGKTETKQTALHGMLSDDRYSNKKDDPVWAGMDAVRQAWKDSGYQARLSTALKRHVDKGLMSDKKADQYWDSRSEKFARTFEQWVQHELLARGQKNTYLAGFNHKEYDGPAPEGHELWPTREEITKMAPAFRALLHAVREKHFSQHDMSLAAVSRAQRVRLMMKRMLSPMEVAMMT